jgi:hypothetical protein
MTPSRRALFGLLAGASVLPWVKPVAAAAAPVSKIMMGVDPAIPGSQVTTIMMTPKNYAILLSGMAVMGHGLPDGTKIIEIMRG